MYKLILLTFMVIPILNLFSQNSAIKKFWSWFENNENRIFNFEVEQDKIFSELKTQLSKIDPNLVFEFSSIENGKREFIISADGIKMSFPSVEKLYKDAPILERWVIIKFRPRREPLYEIEYDGIKVKPEDIAFELIPNQNKIDVVLYINSYSESKRNIYMGITFLFLDTALGEYDVETKVGGIDVKSSNEISNSDENNIRLLPKRFDEIYSRIKNE